MTPTQTLFLAALIVMSKYVSPRQARFWGVVLFIAGLIAWVLE